MGTHPIFESDFDCLTDSWKTMSLSKATLERLRDIGAANTPKRIKRTGRKVARIQVSDLSEDSLTDVRAARPKTRKITKKRGPRGPRMTESQKFKLACTESWFKVDQASNQVLELLEEYCKRHFASMEPWVLRELLRMAHKSLPVGPPKSKIRGILGYFTRSNSVKNWLKISFVLRTVAANENTTTFTGIKEIPYDRVVDESQILSLAGNPRYQERIQVMDAKIERLRSAGQLRLEQSSTSQAATQRKIKNTKK